MNYIAKHLLPLLLVLGLVLAGVTACSDGDTDALVQSLNQALAGAAGGQADATEEPTEVPPTATPLPPITGQILFVSNMFGVDNIFVMNADGSNRVRLTDSPENDEDPTWSK